MANPPWFDEACYLTSKLVQLKNLNPDIYEAWATDDVARSFSDTGRTAYGHFQSYGANELVNPNPYFNAVEYLTAETAQLNATGANGMSNWTID